VILLGEPYLFYIWFRLLFECSQLRPSEDALLSYLEARVELEEVVLVGGRVEQVLHRARTDVPAPSSSSSSSKRFQSLTTADQGRKPRVLCHHALAPSVRPLPDGLREPLGRELHLGEDRAGRDVGRALLEDLLETALRAAILIDTPSVTKPGGNSASTLHQGRIYMSLLD
jgi:hypothetical protein